MAHWSFKILADLIQGVGADYAHHINTPHPSPDSQTSYGPAKKSFISPNWLARCYTSSLNKD